VGGKGRLLIRHRCFLFLVNYARMKPDVALKALPTLEEVCVLEKRFPMIMTDVGFRI
jgi:hypothetical protein